MGKWARQQAEALRKRALAARRRKLAGQQRVYVQVEPNMLLSLLNKAHEYDTLVEMLRRKASAS